MAKQKTTTSRRALVAQLERAGGCTTDPAQRNAAFACGRLRSFPTCHQTATTPAAS